MLVDPALVRGVRLLSLDAGNTVIFLDHARLARLVGERGHRVDAEVLIRTEGEAKRLHESDALVSFAWSNEGAPGARGWGRTVGTMLHRAGVALTALPDAIDFVWREHVALNLWSRVPDGLGAALDRVRAHGVKVVLVSNSEGMLEPLFRRLGILSHFDLLLDSGRLGVEKPDPRIFRLALEPWSIDAGAALHLGDTFATDVLGARAAGMRAALIDPFAHYDGHHEDVARVPGVVEVVDAILGVDARSAR